MVSHSQSSHSSVASQRLVGAPPHADQAVAQLRRQRPITKPAFKKYNTAGKISAMREQQDKPVEKLYATMMSHWKNKGTFVNILLPQGLVRCTRLQLRNGSAVVAYDAVDGDVFDATVMGVKKGRLAANPDWVICNRTSDGKLFLIPSTLVGVRAVGNGGPQ